MDKKELRSKSGKAKKNLIRTQKESNRLKIIIFIAVILVAAVTYYVIDSGSYVATVDNNRISKAEYQFFLSQQQTAVEQQQGLSNKTTEEIKEFWTKTTDGQNPWEDAKRDALDTSKEYMLQLIKAREAGHKVNSNIKSEVTSLLNSYKSSMTDKQFEEYIRYSFNISSNDLSKITENLMLIDEFKNAYMTKNYKPAEITDEEIKAYYDKDPKRFDTVDIRYISFTKLENNAEISAEKLAEKRKSANEVLAKIKQGEDMDKLITEYTEDAVTEENSTKPLGKATITYSTGSMVQNLIDWVFTNKPGDSSVIETDYVIYVVKIDSRSSFEDAKALVKNTIGNNAKEKFYDEALQNWSLEAKYNIVKNERVYESISYK